MKMKAMKQVDLAYEIHEKMQGLSYQDRYFVTSLVERFHQEADQKKMNEQKVDYPNRAQYPTEGVQVACDRPTVRPF